ncbi:MAG: hypothetical protein V4764_06840 [Burkholderia sp.]
MSRTIFVDIEGIFATPSPPWRPGLSFGREWTMLASRNPSRAFLYRAQCLTRCIEAGKPLSLCRWHPSEIMPRPQPAPVPACTPALAPGLGQPLAAKAAPRPHTWALVATLGLVGLLTMPSYRDLPSPFPLLPIVSQPAPLPSPPPPIRMATRQAPAQIARHVPQPQPAHGARHRSVTARPANRPSAPPVHVVRANLPHPRSSRPIAAHLAAPVRSAPPSFDSASFDAMPLRDTPPPAIRTAPARPQVDWMSQLAQRRLTDDGAFLR